MTATHILALAAILGVLVLDYFLRAQDRKRLRELEAQHAALAEAIATVVMPMLEQSDEYRAMRDEMALGVVGAVRRAWER